MQHTSDRSESSAPLDSRYPSKEPAAGPLTAPAHPGAYPRPQAVAAAQLVKDGIDVLHTIGGDDTNIAAANLAAYLAKYPAAFLPQSCKSQ